MAEAPAPSIGAHSSAAQIAQLYREGALISTLMQATGRSYQNIHELLRGQEVGLRDPRVSVALLESPSYAVITTAPQPPCAPQPNTAPATFDSAYDTSQE